MEATHLGVGDFDAFGIGAFVKFAVHPQAGPRCGGCDQLDHGEPTGQRLAAPSLGDVAEQAVLDLVPLRGSGWKVADLKRQAGEAQGSSASFCSSSLNSRTRDPLEPPPSAVIIRRSACG